MTLIKLILCIKIQNGQDCIIGYYVQRGDAGCSKFIWTVEEKGSRLTFKTPLLYFSREKSTKINQRQIFLWEKTHTCMGGNISGNLKRVIGTN